MRKKIRTVNEIQDESKLFNLGEVVRMSTGDEKPRFTMDELIEVEQDIKKRHPDSPELLDSYVRHYGAKTGQEVRDIIIYRMLRELLFEFGYHFTANKMAALDNMSMAKILDLEFDASFKYKINP